MVWYLSGPMTGLPEYNFPAFARAAARLRADGHTVLSAHEIQHDEPAGVGSLTWDRYLRKDLAEMVTHCHGIVVLPGWERSRGARLEIDVAQRLDFEIARYDDLIGLVLMPTLDVAV